MKNAFLRKIVNNRFCVEYGARERNGFRKHSFCGAALAAHVYNYKHKRRVACGHAVSISRFLDREPFLTGNFLYSLYPAYTSFLCSRYLVFMLE